MPLSSRLLVDDNVLLVTLAEPISAEQRAVLVKGVDELVGE